MKLSFFIPCKAPVEIKKCCLVNSQKLSWFWWLSCFSNQRRSVKMLYWDFILGSSVSASVWYHWKTNTNSNNLSLPNNRKIIECQGGYLHGTLGFMSYCNFRICHVLRLKLRNNTKVFFFFFLNHWININLKEDSKMCSLIGQITGRVCIFFFFRVCIF